jgi:hypothetical protein
MSASKVSLRDEMPARIPGVEKLTRRASSAAITWGPS